MTSLENALISLGIDPALAAAGFRAPNATVVAILMGQKFQELGFGFAPAWVGSKHPFLIGWPDLATCDPRQLARWAVQYGKLRKRELNWFIVTGRERKLVVLDFDGAKGRTSRQELERKLGKLTPTVKERTPRVDGGEHYLYLMPPGVDEIKNQQGTLGMKLDVRGYHGGSIIAGSLHETGNRYEFAPGCAPDEVEIAVCPPGWWEWLPKREVAAPRIRKARSTSIARRDRGQHDPSSSIIGDGPEGGSFNRPIRVRCCQFWSLGFGADQVPEFKEILRAEIQAADASNHTPEQIERYASHEYLDTELASAKVWINSQAK